MNDDPIIVLCADLDVAARLLQDDILRQQIEAVSDAFETPGSLVRETEGNWRRAFEYLESLHVEYERRTGEGHKRGRLLEELWVVPTDVPNDPECTEVFSLEKHSMLDGMGILSLLPA